FQPPTARESELNSCIVRHTLLFVLLLISIATTALTAAVAQTPAQAPAPAPPKPEAATPAEESADARPRAVLLTVTGAIGPATAEYLVGAMEDAAADQADFIVIRIDTPGGLVSSMRDINRAILASPI